MAAGALQLLPHQSVHWCLDLPGLDAAGSTNVPQLECAVMRCRVDLHSMNVA